MSVTRSLALLALALPALAFAQGRHEIIRGRVSSDSGRSIRGADVIATNTVDRSTKAVTTDSGGRYSMDWPNGSGDYAVTVSAANYQTRSLHVTRTGDSVIVVDVKLS